MSNHLSMANPNPSPATRVSIGENLCDAEDKITPLMQLKRMQRVLFRITQQPSVDKREAAQCAVAWERLEARKAAMQMRPTPKPIDTIELARVKAKSRERRDAGEIDYRKRKPAPEAPAANVLPMPDSGTQTNQCPTTDVVRKPSDAAASTIPDAQVARRPDPGTRQA